MRSTDPSPLTILHKKLMTTVPSPQSTVSQGTASPLSALAAAITTTSNSYGLIPSTGLNSNTSISQTVPQPSPLLAYATSLSSSLTPSSSIPTQNLSALTQVLGGGAGGSHDNSEDEDYDI